jgi:hypothetical protein|eukprot:SAG25_NODE_985_length_4405_cov_223.335810_2_plen_58_part_00
MISCFMATDMKCHFDIVNKFQMRCDPDGGGFASETPEDRQLLLNAILHGADLVSRDS